MKITTVIPVVFGVVAALFVGYLFSYAAGQEDQISCYTWQHEAMGYQGFYLTRAQADQCSYWHIPVNAPIKLND